MQTLEKIREKFRRGDHADAIEECMVIIERTPDNAEALRLCSIMNGMVGNYDNCSELLKHLIEIRPDDPEALFNLAVSERERNNIHNAIENYLQCLKIDQNYWEAWANLAECQYLLGSITEALKSSEKAIHLHNSSCSAWITKGDCLKTLNGEGDALTCYERAHSISPTLATFLRQGSSLLALGRYDDAVIFFSQAIQIESTQLAAHRGRGDVFNRMGRFHEAIQDYCFVLDKTPEDDEILRKTCLCLQQLGCNQEIMQVCQRVLDKLPHSVTAKIGRSWALSKMVPPWHIPMMNEFQRNNSYFFGMESAALKDKIVFEIGSGSGLLSMMAAKSGAKKVVGCEAVPQIAEIARSIVSANGLQDTVSIIDKPSFTVQIGRDLSERADVLIHEIFSNELLSEQVIPAIEDAKARLLKPDATILPSSASVMCALAGGDVLGRYVSVKESFGFDLSGFNKIAPKKIPFYRQVFQPQLLSKDIEAFCFDFQNCTTFPAEYKTIDIEVIEDGLCYGLIQWIRLDMSKSISYQNHPMNDEPIANWQQVVYRFDSPLTVSKGEIVKIEVAHDRQTLWFDLFRSC